METQATTDERFSWTMALIDATLALRFKDEQLRDAIDCARGNEAKRKAWHALAQRLQKEQGISVPEAKLRRVISKWQSQHRAWTHAVATKNASELALMDRPPTYMPALQRYFKDDSKDEPTESTRAEVTATTSTPTMIPDDDDDEPVTPVQSLPQKSSDWAPPKRIQRPAMVYDAPEPKQRKLSPQKRVETVSEKPKPAVASIPAVSSVRIDEHPTSHGGDKVRETTSVCETPHCATEVRQPAAAEGAKIKEVRDLLGRATKRLSDIQKEQLELQKAHFEEQLAMQRKQYDEQFAVQRKQVEAVHAILASLHGSVEV